MSKMKLGVIEFYDYIWINEQTHLTDFTFYAMYEEMGFPSDFDGFLGLTTKVSEEPSFVKTLAKSGAI